MEGFSTQTKENTTDYYPIRSFESDDSQSNASKSDDNDGIPGIIYTSDDSVDIGESNATFVDSDAPKYIAEIVSQRIEDEYCQEILLMSSNEPVEREEDPFHSHPLSPVISNSQNKLYTDHPKTLAANTSDGIGLTRCNSASSSSTEPELVREIPFLSIYEPLPSYADDEGFLGGLNFECLSDDHIKTQVILSMMTGNTEIKTKKMGQRGRYYVGDIHVDAEYKDAFYVRWNWEKIRHHCVFVHLTLLIGLLCIAIGLLIRMPSESECDPERYWWQGSVTYYIYIPSFCDTDGNGVGDIKGIISKLDYIEKLGIRTARLAPLLEREEIVKKNVLPASYSSVSNVFGDEDDLRLLAALLHEREMFLVLDVPWLEVGEGDISEVDFDGSVNLFDISFILTKWVELGVDGFVFPDIDRVSISNEKLLNILENWRGILDKPNRRLNGRIMMVPLSLLKKVEVENADDVNRLFSLVDLIDVHLHINDSAESVAQAIKDATRWDSHAWINWNLGGVGYRRLSHSSYSSETYNHDQEVEFVNQSLGPMIFQMFLPGSVTIFYGDEINVPDIISDEFIKDIPWASPMVWTSSFPWGGFTDGYPWLPLRGDWRVRNVESLNYSLESLRVMIRTRQQKVPLYINRIFGDAEDYHSTKANNYRIRVATENLLILERYFPRRNKYAIFINLGDISLVKDLSNLYFSGNVLVSSHGKSGYIRFSQLTLEPGEALACILDK